MAISAAVREYRDHRDGVTRTLDRARPWLNLGHNEAWDALLQFRQELSKRMQEFQVFKHKALFDPMIQQGGPRQKIAQQLKAECIKLGTDYTAFQWKWTHADVGVRWPEYRLSALAMMATIRKALADQDAIIQKLEVMTGNGRP